MDLLLDTTTGDLAFRTDGDVALTSGFRRVAQRLRLRLLRWRGEWLLDRRIGVPYRGTLFDVKPPRLSVLGAELKRVIVGTEGVDALERFELRQVGAEVVCVFDVRVDGAYVTGVLEPTQADFAIAFTDATGAPL